MHVGGEWLIGCALWALASGCSGVGSEGDEVDGSVEQGGSIESELSKNALSASEQATVLKLVDDICGDTWCEGDHNFSFDRLHCQRGCAHAAGACTLSFRVFPYDSDVASGPTYQRRCKTSGFSGFASLVQTSSNGYQSLVPDYFSALTECIGRIESELPPVQ